eukprot:2377221-Prymnesium_polylepis.1
MSCPLSWRFSSSSTSISSNRVGAAIAAVGAASVRPPPAMAGAHRLRAGAGEVERAVRRCHDPP